MKRVIITGASDGLGKELAKVCVAEDIEVIALSRSNPNRGGGRLCSHRD